jgi:tripartite ATP-independent transporter DctP family solute receptor
MGSAVEVSMKRFLVLAAAALLVPSVALAQTVTLKLATIVGNDNPFTTSAVKFKEVAEAKSGGRIKVEVYPAGQLAKNEIVQLEGMQLGTVDVAAMSLPSIGGKWDSKMLATDVPFLYTGREHVWKVNDGPVGKELMNRFEPLGAKPFCYGGGWGFRGVLSNKRPVTSPDDLKGQTIRVPPVPTLVEVFKAFGANPVPMIWGEVYLAVKQGTVDGLELPVTTAVSDKFHEITKYYSRTLHSYPSAVWAMAKPKYEALPADLKRVIDETMAVACTQHRQDELKAEIEGLAQMKAKGMQVNEIKDLRPFQERAQPVWKFVEQKVGKELFDRVIAEAKAAAK